MPKILPCSHSRRENLIPSARGAPSASRMLLRDATYVSPVRKRWEIAPREIPSAGGAAHLFTVEAPGTSIGGAPHFKAAASNARRNLGCSPGPQLRFFFRRWELLAPT